MRNGWTRCASRTGRRGAGSRCGALRDDPERTIWYSPGEYEDDCPDYVADYEEDIRRYRCPLQVRALLGDRTVPCCEALSLSPDQEMMERAERSRKWEEGQGRRPEELVPPQPDT